MSARLLWPDLEPDAVAEGFIAEMPEVALSSGDVLAALSRRHPMDGFNGMPGRWVFVREVQASTGSYSDVQRFDAVAIGLTPAVKHARVVFEVKVSRADWLREMTPIPDVRWTMSNGAEMRASPREARAIAEAIAEGHQSTWIGYRHVGEYRKWDAALAVSTEFWVAAPPRCVQLDELPPEAGLLEIRPWGKEREMRALVIRKAPVRDTPNPDHGFWAAVLRRTAAR